MNRGSPIASRVTPVLAVLTAVAVHAQIEVPYLTGRVNDYAGILSPDVEGRLESRLEAVEETHGAQIVVLTVPTLDGEPIEDFGIRVAEAWKIGRGEVDDGVILVVASEDRRMRIEVGYGLEATIPDAYARRILDNLITPRFRAGDFDGGVEAGVEALSTLIEGGELPAPDATQSTDSGGLGCAAWPMLAFLGLFSLNLLRIRGPAGWVPYIFMMPFWYFVPYVTVGNPLAWVALALWVLGFPVLRAIVRKVGGDKWISSGGGGWSSSSGWGGGGGFSGGGFSGGGGSFGGGGASGSW